MTAAPLSDQQAVDCLAALIQQQPDAMRDALTTRLANALQSTTLKHESTAFGHTLYWRLQAGRDALVTAQNDARARDRRHPALRAQWAEIEAL